MGIVSVTNHKKLYGDFAAVDGISLNMLIGLSRPSGGKISIDRFCASLYGMRKEAGTII
jgi:hypothetical protein